MSFLATSYKSPQINSIQQLADSGDFKMVTIKGLVTENEILVNISLKQLKGTRGVVH